MTNQYCYLGNTNKCYKECDKKCLTRNNYYLNDRLNSKYRIIPDNSSTITTIYNYKPLVLNSNKLNKKSFRIDVLDEDFEEIKGSIRNI